MKIGEAIQHLQRSDFEGERILTSVISGIGKPSEIYTRYSSLSENQPLWTKAQKVLRVTGFRPGKAKAIILQRVKKGIEESNPQSIQIFWMIYFESVVAFLRTEHQNLNQLLLERDLDSDPDSTEELIKAIKKVSVIYEVTESQIEDFYEVYWFERVKRFKDIEPQSNFDIEIVEQLIKKSEKKQFEAIDSLRKEIGKIEAPKSNARDIDELKITMSNLGSSLEELKHGLEIEAAKLERNFAELIEARISEFEHKLVSGNDKDQQEKIETQIASTQENIARLNKKIETLTIEKERKEARKKRVLVSNEAALSARLRNLSEVQNLSDEQISLTKNLLNSQSAFYVESDTIFSSICYELISEQRVKEIVLTSSKSHFSEEEYQDFLLYDAIYLKNISASFVEGTVKPVLISTNSVVNQNFPIVFVEFDSELNSTIETQIHKCSIALSIDFFNQIHQLKISKDISEPGSEQSTKILNFYNDIPKFLKNSGIYLDSQVFERMIKVGTVVSRSTSDEVAFNFSLMTVMLPFIKSSYGDTKAQVIEELLNGFKS